MSSLPFKILQTFSDGEVRVLINNHEYIYYIDAGFIPKIERMAKRNPGKALNFLKKVARHYVKTKKEV